MKCHEVQELFSVYWDAPENDSQRLDVDTHLEHCEICKEEFRLWEESEALIRNLSESEDITGPLDHINREVMERIYAEQTWYMPVYHKTYQFTRSFRRNAAIAVACCMAMFATALLVLVFNNQTASPDTAQMTGLIETANASEGSAFTAAYYADVPVASISDPLVLKVVPTYPQYWIALSILGLIMAMLMLNWLARTRH
ncbi:zf-HC2 domain-containing protein [Paenibacillus beijingensis]|uniref:Putative zinc-finger domain-containing protein n=1 Tax=Paenibacillus beijingensis TaxID=1126833 RepID=A0A0D5NPD4_9BACL|nr:zf-HC2 domain-containing protein [Paenibacillus beijingensis]AJY77154.1 hypothetical protein VN24_24650 [Paenibacillus beijingensis]